MGMEEQVTTQQSSQNSHHRVLTTKLFASRCQSSLLLVTSVDKRELNFNEYFGCFARKGWKRTHTSASSCPTVRKHQFNAR